jgi:predicted PurR-regulated permease PerM
MLTRWMSAHLTVWLAGIVVMIATAGREPVFTIGLVTFLASLVPYVGALIYAYRVQNALHRAGLYKHGAWQIVAGGLLLNPLVLGFVIPVSVINTARAVEQRLKLAAVVPV